MQEKIEIITYMTSLTHILIIHQNEIKSYNKDCDESYINLVTSLGETYTTQLIYHKGPDLVIL